VGRGTDGGRRATLRGGQGCRSGYYSPAVRYCHNTREGVPGVVVADMVPLITFCATVVEGNQGGPKIGARRKAPVKVHVGFIDADAVGGVFNTAANVVNVPTELPVAMWPMLLSVLPACESMAMLASTSRLAPLVLGLIMKFAIGGVKAEHLVHVLVIAVSGCRWGCRCSKRDCCLNDLVGAGRHWFRFISDVACGGDVAIGRDRDHRLS